MLNFLYKIIMIPTGVGILGVMLFLEKEESWLYRLLGLIVGILLSPFLIGVGAFLIVEEAFEQCQSRKHTNKK